MKKLTDLTPEEKRVLCAEACLIKCADYGDEKFFHSGDPLHQMMWPDSSQHNHLPHYDTSLDAMHEAEATLDSEPMDVRSKWLDYLAIACDWPITKNAADLRFEVQYLCARSTAAQRLDAFLIAKGLAK